ncbi:TetR/AcrR family transcriptional regulator [Paraburkholderia sp. IMGN_8]|uniref:TetR/AcrR family transcriptional regulator n=1 Tax=Paraburkholderia sp. IMGN_8 TaxID=3136564 RepID=UPI003100BC2B
MFDTRGRRVTKRTPSPERPAVVAATRSTTRGVRRKEETRTRLLDAALRLMAERGMEGVAISEITAAADVGFGSFYNHFESKGAIYAALIEQVFEDYADMLDVIAGGLPDPAEAIAVSVRHTLMRARGEPLWGRFLIREGLSDRALRHGLGQRLWRDTQRGIADKRFFIADPFVGLLSLKGTLLAAAAAQLHFMTPASGVLDGLGAEREHFAERTAAVVLQMLGLQRAEAEHIAMRALPELNGTGRSGQPRLRTVPLGPPALRRPGKRKSSAG